MSWDVWINIFVTKNCWARGLQPMTIVTYKDVLKKFKIYSEENLSNKQPRDLSTQDLCEYFEYLRKKKGNGNATINKVAVVLKSFYKCAVSFEMIKPDENPTRNLPKLKKPLEIAGDVLSSKEMNKLTNAPDPRTVVGLRDRAVLLLLCTTGIRASECEGLRIKDVDFQRSQARVVGKGGHERAVNLNKETITAINNYLKCRISPNRISPLFKVRTGNRLTRWRIYERVQFYLKKARIFKNISPHRLRHSFATLMIKNGTNVVVLKELLGHRCVTSTLRYIQISGEQLREAINKLKVDTLFEKILAKFPEQKRRYQRPVLDSS
jgi:integrase/recombinase XerD